MTDLQRLWHGWTAPQAADPDEATREYITRVVAAMMGLALIVTTAVIFAGWAAGAFDLESIPRILAIDLVVGLGLWLNRRGHWRVTSYLLPAILFLQATYGAYQSAAETQLGFYALTILLAGTLHGIRAQWYAVGLSLLTYLLALWFSPVPVRDVELLAILATEAAIFFIGITLLQWLFVSQLEGALGKARRYATELAKHQDHLEELVKARYQELQAANRELEREIAQRREAEAALQEAHTRLEAHVQERTAELEAANRQLVQENAERQRVEEALRESEARYRQLVEHAPAGIYEIDLTNLRFLSVNDVICEYTGYTRQEFLAMSPLEIMEEESRQRFLERYARLMVGEPIPETAEFKIRTKNGRQFWVALNVRLSPHEGQGEPLTATVVVHDVTARRQAEEALRRSQALLESLVQSLPQNIYSKDLEGRFTFANQQYCATAGMSPEELVGKTNFDIHPPQLARKYQEDDRRVIESRQPFETVEEHQPPGQDSFYVQVIKSPIYDADGQVTGILGIFWDITERWRAEEARRRSLAE
ncbi:MAG: PAS domain S-box protein, partial [Anaerolineae bacterium]